MTLPFLSPMKAGSIGVHLHKWAADNKLAAGTIGADLRQWAQARSLQQGGSPKLGAHTLPPLPSHPFSSPTHRVETHRTPPSLPQHITSETFDPPKIPFDIAKSKSLFGENGGSGRGLGFDPPGAKPHGLFGDPSKSKHMMGGGPFDKEGPPNSFDMEAKNGGPDTGAFGEGRSAFDIKNTYSSYGSASSGNKKGDFDTGHLDGPGMRDNADRMVLGGSSFQPSSDFVHSLLADLDQMKQFYQTVKHEQHNLQTQMNRWSENVNNLKFHQQQHNSTFASPFSDQGMVHLMQFILLPLPLLLSKQTPPP